MKYIHIDIAWQINTYVIVIYKQCNILILKYINIAIYQYYNI